MKLKHVGLGALLAVGCVGYLVAMFSTAKDDAAKLRAEQATAAEPAPVVAVPVAEARPNPAATLDITLDEYLAAFNVVLDSERAAHISASVEPGRVNDVAKVQLTPAAHLVITLVKGTREVREIAFLGVPDEHTSAEALMVSSLVAARSAFPEEQREEVSKRFTALGTRLTVDGDQQSEVFGGRSVSMSLSTSIGYMVVISPES